MTEEIYFPELKCVNCKKSNFLKVEKGKTIQEYVEEKSLLCEHCRCTPIKIKEEKEE